ncbi:MAG: helix-turn-helix domain-containing protein [Rhodospirillaceae bacterium]|nr:helix-turn-helix domain-containing protein [Rhodospirillaceae bacterium]
MPPRNIISLLTVSEVADQCRVDPKTVRNWIYAGELPALKLGGRWRIDESVFRRWLSAREFHPYLPRVSAA